MYKYFKELEKPKEFISYLGLPIDYYDFKSYYDKLWDETMHVSVDGTNGVIYNWPNAWYITPNGYLYNTGSGHKEGNLIYAYERIRQALEQKNETLGTFINQKNTSNITLVKNQSHINEILARNYITHEEFRHYSNLCNFPISPSMTFENNSEKILKHYEGTSNQKSLITLIIGHLAAETCLYSFFVRMNESKRKKDLIAQINEMDFKDILVKFTRFNKIETALNSTITTSSLNGIQEFSEYLKNGWNLQIIPGLIYDATLDKLTEVDFNSPIVNRHLDNELNSYNGKGKVLIRHKTF